MTQPPEDAFEGRYAFALRTALEAADSTLPHFAGGVEVTDKSDGSPVTIADQQAERLIRDRLASSFPGDGILGEEFEPVPSSSGWRWIIDPIDGTFSFIHGVPLYTTLLAAERLGDDGEPIHGAVEIGVIVAPAIRDVVYAATGHGAWRQLAGGPPSRARVTQAASLERATVSTTSADYHPKPGDRKAWAELERQAAHTRGWPDAYGPMLVATGRCDACFEPTMNPWDAGPILPIVREAGGRVTDFTGHETVHGKDLLVSNGLIHDELVGVVSRSR